MASNTENTRTADSDVVVDQTVMQHLDPTGLLTDLNVRHDDRLDKAFVASIKDLGVLQPVVAYNTEAGVRVRYGHRRTAAAVEAGLAVVPVIVVADEADDDAATIERLLSQYAENEHRTGLSNAERVGVVTQLSLLGMSPAKIAKRTQTKRTDVDAAIAVSGSDLAKAATVRYDWLTLDQAAAVAEFEDDTEAVTRLVKAAQRGQFEHTVQRMRDDRAEAAAHAALAADLTAQGLTVIDAPGPGTHTPYALSSLVDGKSNALDAEAHATGCDGHVVWIGNVWEQVDRETGEPVPEDTPEDDQAWDRLVTRQTLRAIPGCADPKAHGHSDRYASASGTGRVRADQMSDAERDAAKAARRLVIENNKAWDSAEIVRREWVKTFLTRKTPPAGLGAFLVDAMVRDHHHVASTEGNHLAAEWFGVEAPTYGHSLALADTANTATDKRAQVLALGLVLADYEASLDRASWRSDGTHSTAGRYLRFLAANGYTCSDVEEYAISEQTA
ncbi:ParB/RepB/Spo0J family partition protein [Solicola sp. PLA-1-18]|uniref:ParB/RepB/Spo0J family partition protein n=1 Tax=Solicola sp. PLA-1-18 TaxID=3380532 RepID=UPI003B7DC9A7